MSDKVQLLEDGQIRFKLNGDTFMVRPPRLGEYKKLREFALAQVRQIKEEAEEQEAEGLVRDGIDVIVAFMMCVFNGNEELGLRPLSDKVLENEDDLPPWFGSATLQQKMFVHWREVPLDLGSN